MNRSTAAGFLIIFLLGFVTCQHPKGGPEKFKLPPNPQRSEERQEPHPPLLPPHERALPNPVPPKSPLTPPEPPSPPHSDAPYKTHLSTESVLYTSTYDPIDNYSTDSYFLTTSLRNSISTTSNSNEDSLTSTESDLNSSTTDSNEDSSSFTEFNLNSSTTDSNEDSSTSTESSSNFTTSDSIQDSSTSYQLSTTLSSEKDFELEIISSRTFNNPHFMGKRKVIVHLHEWTYQDIARECEQFLGPQGYAGVQTSPASENVIMPGRPWYERYQPISYKIITRSGNEKDFYEMTQRCRAVGVRIYVDVVPNHMTANLNEAVGTGGSFADPHNFEYPAVPYSANDFHQPPCTIEDFNDLTEARICELVGLHDLNQGIPRVQWIIANYLDRLVALGAAGFRVDATKHMYPQDLEKIYARIRDLPEPLGFSENSAPFIYQEVGDGWKFNYTHLGAVTEFAHASNMASFFKNQRNAPSLRNYGGQHMGMLESEYAFVFVDNHDLQRQNPFTLTYKNPREFKAAYAFTLAHPYGIARVMSSFDFKDDQQGPPHDSKYNIKSPRFNSRGQATNGWVAEHRWPSIVNMVKFRNVVGDSPLTNWWDDEDGVLSFCRGDRGFVIISAGRYDFNGIVQTCLPAGTYCNAVSERKTNGDCKKDSIVLVYRDGYVFVDLPSNGKELFFALHIGDKIN